MEEWNNYKFDRVVVEVDNSVVDNAELANELLTKKAQEVFKEVNECMKSIKVEDEEMIITTYVHVLFNLINQIKTLLEDEGIEKKIDIKLLSIYKDKSDSSNESKEELGKRPINAITELYRILNYEPNENEDDIDFLYDLVYNKDRLDEDFKKSLLDIFKENGMIPYTDIVWLDSWSIEIKNLKSYRIKEIESLIQEKVNETLKDTRKYVQDIIVFEPSDEIEGSEFYAWIESETLLKLVKELNEVMLNQPGCNNLLAKLYATYRIKENNITVKKAVYEPLVDKSTAMEYLHEDNFENIEYSNYPLEKFFNKFRLDRKSENELINLITSKEDNL